MFGQILYVKTEVMYSSNKTNHIKSISQDLQEEKVTQHSIVLNNFILWREFFYASRILGRTVVHSKIKINNSNSVYKSSNLSVTCTKASSTVQKNKFSIKNFFSKCDQIRSKIWIWSHLLKKSFMENFIFWAV